MASKSRDDEGSVLEGVDVDRLDRRTLASLARLNAHRAARALGVDYHGQSHEQVVAEAGRGSAADARAFRDAIWRSERTRG